MSKQVPVMKTAADLVAFVQEFGSAQLTQLNGLLDKVPDNLKADYLAMRDKMNALLKGLPPLDQVPAAQEASWALNSFARTISEMFDYADMQIARIAGMTKTLEEKSTALNGLNEQITKGELISKDKVEIAVNSARTEAAKPFQTEIAGLRGEQIALCGLPAAPASVLELAADAFGTALAQAKKNLGVCTGKGMVLGKNGDTFIKKTVWLEETAFNGEAKILEDLAENLKIKLPGGDPMLGAPGTKAEKTTEDAAPKRFTMA